MMFHCSHAYLGHDCTTYNIMVSFLFSVPDFTHVGFVLGFDETVYEVSESAGAVEICVQVFNPPNHLHFSTVIPLSVLTVDASASEIVLCSVHV